ncbi:MAG: YcaQ family DNA glycosylase [Acidobacteria bacterium]|nr:YcaQ family DNA glycosylase [Acidobacteriota bacterium]
MPRIYTINSEQARRFLIHHLGLTKRHDHAPSILHRLRVIQIDPLNPMGCNPDFVLASRLNTYRVGGWTELFAPLGFEHYAKERCLIDAASFPQYRDNHVQTSWWKHRDRQSRLNKKVVASVLEEIEARGPIRASELSDRGKVDPLDWSGWKGTSSLTTLALELLWITCKVVVAKRTQRDKYFDLPQRALPDQWTKPSWTYASWAIEDRIQSAGLLAETAGPCWSTIDKLRKSSAVEQLIKAGRIVRLKVEGHNRTFLAPLSALDTISWEPDHEMRILGPLEPLIWDRKLVQHIFGFDYVWEVYKPAAKRTWGWYVQPLLWGEKMVGRLEGKTEHQELVIKNIWPEKGFDAAALRSALERHATICGCHKIIMPGEA